MVRVLGFKCSKIKRILNIAFIRLTYLNIRQSTVEQCCTKLRIPQGYWQSSNQWTLGLDVIHMDIMPALCPELICSWQMKKKKRMNNYLDCCRKWPLLFPKSWLCRNFALMGKVWSSLANISHIRLNERIYIHMYIQVYSYIVHIYVYTYAVRYVLKTS